MIEKEKFIEYIIEKTPRHIVDGINKKELFPPMINECIEYGRVKENEKAKKEIKEIASMFKKAIIDSGKNYLSDRLDKIIEIADKCYVDSIDHRDKLHNNFKLELKKAGLI